MPNPLIAEYQQLANELDATVAALVAANQPLAAQQVGAAQGVLRATCITLIANDIDTILDPNDPQMAEAIADITEATTALRSGAAALARDVRRVTTVVGLATAAGQLAGSLIPPNIAEIAAAAKSTASLLR